MRRLVSKMRLPAAAVVSGGGDDGDAAVVGCKDRSLHLMLLWN